MRLQKYMADCGVASRRKCEEIILSGRVTINDEIASELGIKVAEGDVVKVNGKVITPSSEHIYILLHKPEGYITTAQDQFDRPTVLNLLSDELIKHRLYPVGRLDYDTSGLLLLTNDGDLTFKLTHPKHNVEKVYIAKVLGKPTEEELIKFRNGVVIDGYKTAKSKCVIVKEEGIHCSLKITIKEGKNRQVRKMCEAIDHKVVGLKRIATGKLFLGELKRGEYRNLTDDEVMYLRNL
ncbi:MAG: pseudouridine synthase [Lachnospirales bacterium]